MFKTQNLKLPNNCQLSNVNCQRIGPARGHRPTNRSTVNYQLSTVNCQLSTFP
ncbi:MAG: hypothetical protein HC786_02125 [Richelia sp. CSU_2_1]|nr:hypothetical protein [Microcoleus sp. SU_5_6]NJR21048.1 hypothetical protein [Richelia sp. CSU_2_1]